AEAKIEIAEARGNAEAIHIKADAEAYYNRAIAASLSPLIVPEDWIEKWNGTVPTVVGGQNMMFDMSKFTGK
ncbi:MAG: prohibitin family protein, partial [Bacteroidales bacterium]|nr:prohibitin family protein [Bacteroidales bacterium]